MGQIRRYPHDEDSYIEHTIMTPSEFKTALAEIAQYRFTTPPQPEKGHLYWDVVVNDGSNEVLFYHNFIDELQNGDLWTEFHYAREEFTDKQWAQVLKAVREEKAA